jgi:phage-related protein
LIGVRKSVRLLRVLDLDFYQTAAGNEPVREWLTGLPKAACRTIGGDLFTVQTMWPMGKPLVDGFGDGLWEVRSTHEGIEYRVLFGIVGGRMVVLHGFVKKTQKTSKADVAIGRTRLADVAADEKAKRREKAR